MRHDISLDFVCISYPVLFVLSLRIGFFGVSLEGCNLEVMGDCEGAGYEYPMY